MELNEFRSLWLQVNHVYYISKFNVKPANKQFTSIKHDYELSFNNDTQVIPCVEDTSDIPQVTYDFVTIADIEHVYAGKTIGEFIKRKFSW